MTAGCIMPGISSEFTPDGSLVGSNDACCPNSGGSGGWLTALSPVLPSPPPPPAALPPCSPFIIAASVALRGLKTDERVG